MEYLGYAGANNRPSSRHPQNARFPSLTGTHQTTIGDETKRSGNDPRISSLVDSICCPGAAALSSPLESRSSSRSRSPPQPREREHPVPLHQNGAEQDRNPNTVTPFALPVPLSFRDRIHEQRHNATRSGNPGLLTKVPPVSPISATPVSVARPTRKAIIPATASAATTATAAAAAASATAISSTPFSLTLSGTPSVALPRTMDSTPIVEARLSSLQSLASSSQAMTKPFVVSNSRTYLSDPSLPYPLPVDLEELHRQSLRTLFFFQLFGGPLCSPCFNDRPPVRVLELGCGSGFWSTMCNEYYTRQGHHGIMFTGMDKATTGRGASSAGGKSRPSYSASSSSLSSSPPRKTAGSEGKVAHDKDKGVMNWRFVQHDMRRLPWPFSNEEFDLVMVKDMSLAITTDMYQLIMDECIRVLQPGGTLEMWDSDHTIRILRPHVPGPATTTTDEDDYEAASGVGAYVLTPNTPFSAPLNRYIAEYNGWMVKALEARLLPFVPCSLVGALFLQEAGTLTGTGSRRLAVPLSEIKWEREGVGGVVTKDGKTYIETKGKGRESEKARRTITRAQSALRHTALRTVVQMVHSLEPLLKEVSGKSQDEWDAWYGKMTNDLLKDGGTAWGECLEVGSWWARKRQDV